MEWSDMELRQINGILTVHQRDKSLPKISTPKSLARALISHRETCPHATPEVAASLGHLADKCGRLRPSDYKLLISDVKQLRADDAREESQRFAALGDALASAGFAIADFSEGHFRVVPDTGVRNGHVICGGHLPKHGLIDEDNLMLAYIFEGLGDPAFIVAYFAGRAAA